MSIFASRRSRDRKRDKNGKFARGGSKKPNTRLTPHLALNRQDTELESALAALQNAGLITDLATNEIREPARKYAGDSGIY